MGRKAPARPTVVFRKPKQKSLDLGREAIYGAYFHGPAYQVIERAAVERGVGGGPLRSRPGAEHLSQGRRPRHCAPAAGAAVPGRGPVAPRPARDDGPAHVPRPGGLRPPLRGPPGGSALRGGGRAGRRARPSTPASSTRRGASTSSSSATAPSPCPSAGRSRGRRRRSMRRSFSRVAIVNRGEAALRFIHAARELNREGERLRTIALHTDTRPARAVRAGGRRGLRPRPGPGRGSRRAASDRLRGPARSSSGRWSRRRRRRRGRGGASWRRCPSSWSCASGSG